MYREMDARTQKSLRTLAHAMIKAGHVQPAAAITGRRENDVQTAKRWARESGRLARKGA